MLDSLQLKVRDEFISDGGPYYHEFVTEGFFREPWNTYSSLLFFVPIVFWLIKLKRNYNQHLIIVFILPFLFLNGLGSTLYHANRDVPFFFFLDFLPASCMSILLSTYFWNYLRQKIVLSLLIVASFYFLGAIAWILIVQFESTQEIGPNIGYFFVGLSFVVPILLILKKTDFYKWKVVSLGICFLILALLFRVLDHPSDLLLEGLQQGTHFLWHVFTVVAVFYFGYYVYFLNLKSDFEERDD